MSLHLNQQCQRADALPLPVRLVPGIGCTDQEEARNERRPLEGGRVRRCEAPYMGEAPSRQPGFLQLCCSPPAALRNGRNRPAWSLDKELVTRFKTLNCCLSWL